MRRRNTIGLAAFSGITALVLAACGGSSGSPSPGPSSAGFNAAITSTVNPSTHKGGTITFNLTTWEDSMDPGGTYYAANWNFTRYYATPLMTYNSCQGSCGLHLIPALATAPGTPSSNNTVWTYHIKSGMKFSDGQPITSADVKYAVMRTFAKEVLPGGPVYFQNLLAGNAATYKGPYKDKGKDLTSVTTPNSTTVVFHLNKPFADFNYVVAIPQTAPVPKNKDTGASYQLHPVSSGPYMVQSATLNKTFVLVPNPNWNPAMDPAVHQYASKIILNINPNANDIDNRLIAGDIQMDMAGTGVQSAARAKIVTNPTLKASSDDPVTGFMWFIYQDTQVPPLTNVHCRMAIEYAANKTTLQDAYGGPYQGSIATTAMPPNIIGYKHFDLYNAGSHPGGDTAAAKQQLSLCGKPNGFSIGMAYRSDRPRDTSAAQALQAALAPVGIKVSLHGFPSGTYFTNFAGVPKYMTTHGIGLATGGWGPDWPDAYGWGWALFDGKAIVPAGNTNIGALNDPVVNNLFLKLEAATSASAQATISGQIDMQLMKDAVIVPAVYAKALLYRSSDLTNMTVQPYYGMYNYGTLGTK
ncbi:MAG TPA: ABC transporter substrate-binding protein [Streptosporangiaceae bacterium]|nr:ABC transporter substrate-binding protein [Streptosporangiaceae bacterium]